MFITSTKFALINVLYLFLFYEGLVATDDWDDDWYDFSSLGELKYFSFQDSTESTTGDRCGISGKFDDVEDLDAPDELTSESSATNATETNKGDNEVLSSDDFEDINALDEVTSESSAISSIESNADDAILDVSNIFDCSAPHTGILKCIIKSKILNSPILHRKYFPNFKENKRALPIPKLDPSGNAANFPSKINGSLHSWIQKIGMHKKPEQ